MFDNPLKAEACKDVEIDINTDMERSKDVFEMLREMKELHDDHVLSKEDRTAKMRDIVGKIKL